MERPTSLTVLGVTHLMFGFLGVCWGLTSLFGAFAMCVMSGAADGGAIPQSPESAAMVEVMFGPAHAAFMGVSGGLRLLAGGGLIIAGIGLFILKPWARTLSILYGVYGITMAIAFPVGYLLVIMRPIMAAMAEEVPAQGMPESAMMAGQVIWAAFQAGLKLMYPLVVLVLMFVPHVKEALRKNSQQQDEPGPPPLREA
jgi:hypothetical protein